ncbi:MAG: hypothetical protein ABL907_22240 [Hyphomicrobium sp.]
MSLTETIAPTAERMRKGDVLQPSVSQTENRRGYTKEDEFDRMKRAGRLDPAQYNAAADLRRHYLGAQGVNVSNGEGGPAGREFPRTVHAQAMWASELAVTPREWAALMILLQETGNIESVGGALCQIKNPPQARIAGAELVRTALDRLAILYGYIQPKKPPRPY